MPVQITATKEFRQAARCTYGTEVHWMFYKTVCKFGTNDVRQSDKVYVFKNIQHHSANQTTGAGGIL